MNKLAKFVSDLFRRPMPSASKAERPEAEYEPAPMVSALASGPPEVSALGGRDYTTEDGIRWHRL